MIFTSDVLNLYCCNLKLGLKYRQHSSLICARGWIGFTGTDGAVCLYLLGSFHPCFCTFSVSLQPIGAMPLESPSVLVWNSSQSSKTLVSFCFWGMNRLDKKRKDKHCAFENNIEWPQQEGKNMCCGQTWSNEMLNLIVIEIFSRRLLTLGFNLTADPCHIKGPVCGI